MAGLTYAMWPAAKIRAYWERLATAKASAARQCQFDGQMVTFRSSAEMQAEINELAAHLELLEPGSVPAGVRRRRRGIRVRTSGKGFR